MSEKVNVSESGEKVLNTRRLQIFELNTFMLNELHAVYDGVGFTDVEFGTQYSFDHAVKLFNEREDKDLDDYMLDRVKLRYNKRQKRIVCLNNFVKASSSLVSECEQLETEPLDVIVQVMNTLRLR